MNNGQLDITRLTGEKLGDPPGNRTLNPRIKNPNPGIRSHTRSSDYARSYPVFGGQVSGLVRVHPDPSRPIVDESVDGTGQRRALGVGT